MRELQKGERKKAARGEFAGDKAFCCGAAAKLRRNRQQSVEVDTLSEVGCVIALLVESLCRSHNLAEQSLKLNASQFFPVGRRLSRSGARGAMSDPSISSSGVWADADGGNAEESHLGFVGVFSKWFNGAARHLLFLGSARAFLQHELRCRRHRHLNNPFTAFFFIASFFSSFFSAVFPPSSPALLHINSQVAIFCVGLHRL